MKKKQNERKKNGASGVLMILFSILVGAFCGIQITSFLDHAQFRSGGGEILAFLVLILGMYLMMYLQIIVHEGGHLIFGLLSGYSFASFRVGSLMLMKTEKGICLKRFRLLGTGGQCLMVPPALKNGTMPVTLYNLGGVILNLAASLVLGLLSMLWPGSAAAALLRIGTVIGVMFALLNGVPFRMGAVNNDGSNVCAMRKDPEAVRALWMQLTVNEQSRRGVRLRDMPEAWFCLPQDADMNNSLICSSAVFAENRLLDQRRFADADAAAQALLDGNNALPGVYRGMLLCDRIFLAVLRGADPSAFLTRDQERFMKRMKDFPSVVRTQAALALRAGDLQRAEALCARLEALAASYPNPSDIESERELIRMLFAQEAERRPAPSAV